MFATSFPDLQWLKDQAENRFYRTTSGGKGSGWPTVVLNVKASNIYRDNIPGPLSLFSNLSGTSRVMVEGRAITVPPECFFMTNELQRYTLEISKAQAETLNIHFGEGWSRGAVASLTQDHNHLVDYKVSGGMPAFYNKLYRKTGEIRALLSQLQELGNGDGLRRDEILLRILRELIREQRDVAAREHNLSAAKASTRQEIMRRLHLATDYMHSSLGRAVSLDELAGASAMSKFHLLRVFEEAMGQSPYQYMSALKIEKAKSLLATTRMEVAEISRSLGFDTSSTFSRRFRKVTGISPLRFRVEN